MGLEVEFNIHNHTAKRLYWLQVPKKKLINKDNADNYWAEAMGGMEVRVNLFDALVNW